MKRAHPVFQGSVLKLDVHPLLITEFTPLVRTVGAARGGMFGRYSPAEDSGALEENGNGGTDHGHGNVMWVMGGPVNGGKVYGEWPGLSTDRLYQSRDLAVTTDFRTAIGTVVERHMRLPDRSLSTIFPEMPQGQGRLTGIVKA